METISEEEFGQVLEGKRRLQNRLRSLQIAKIPNPANTNAAITGQSMKEEPSC